MHNCAWMHEQVHLMMQGGCSQLHHEIETVIMNLEVTWEYRKELKKRNLKAIDVD